MNGSAPRARGTPRSDRFKTMPEPGQPRVRGEHLPRTDLINRVFGSAPRARGTRLGVDVVVVVARVSPACAGNTAAAPRAGTSPPGQPRVRGEHGGTVA